MEGRSWIGAGEGVGSWWRRSGDGGEEAVRRWWGGGKEMEGR